MKQIKFFFLFYLMITASKTFSQKNDDQIIFTQDIKNFWVAYDSVVKIKDSAQQVEIIKTLYLDKGTPGLKAFMEVRGYSAPLYVKLIKRFPKFWKSVRPNTLRIDEVAINKSLARFKELYPELQPVKMYFTIGGLSSGGTTKSDMILIGSEIATGDPSTDVSEFTNKWLEGVFKNQNQENLVYLNIHEYVHTQQNMEGTLLLSRCLKEGSADFVSEIVLNKLLNNNYIVYGRAHEKELKEQFKEEMLGYNSSNWLFQGGNAKTVADLGYFMGYSICKAYYEKASDKRKAIKEIIELNFSDDDAVKKFLDQSGYYN